MCATIWIRMTDLLPLVGSTGTASKPGNGAVPPEIVAAAEKSLASSLLGRFSEGYQQMLGRRFERGVDLSGGEWQKVALARAYMRDAQVLILDEPTAALDARAEYEVFVRFSGLMQGKMAVIISHRFSTVRMAERIIVLHQGEIVEQGSHSELMANQAALRRVVHVYKQRDTDNNRRTVMGNLRTENMEWGMQ